MAQLLVKDASTFDSKNFNKVLLYTQENDKGVNFFNGLAPKNLYKDNDAKKKVEGLVNQITRFNVWLDAVIERKNGFWIINDCKIIE
jgi:hypothetical protein